MYVSICYAVSMLIWYRGSNTLGGRCHGIFSIQFEFAKRLVYVTVTTDNAPPPEKYLKLDLDHIQLLQCMCVVCAFINVDGQYRTVFYYLFYCIDWSLVALEVTQVAALFPLQLFPRLLLLLLSVFPLLPFQYHPHSVQPTGHSSQA